MTQIIPVIWLLVGSLCLGVVGRVAIPPLAWIALTLLLHASMVMPVVRGSVLVWIALYIGAFIATRGSIPIPGISYFGIIAVIATTGAIPLVINRVFAGRLDVFWATLLFPTAWVAMEFLRSRLEFQATWGSIAYTQFGNLALMQVAAFVGIWGVTFLVTWLASTAELAWSRGFAWSAIGTPALAFAIVFATAILAGAARVAMAPTDGRTMRVATLNRPIDLFVPGEMTRITEGRISPDERTRMDEKLRRLQDWFLEGSRREARAGARLIAWPEQNLLVLAEDEPAFLDRARNVAAEERIYLAMGMGTIRLGDPRPFENKLVLIDPSGRTAMSYRKSHPVPGWEASIMKRGDGRLPVIATTDGRIAAAICFDADFPELVRQAGKGDADILIIPANDMKPIKTAHFQMAVFRAVETGASIVRPAASGISSGIDPWGRVVGVADYFAEGDRAMSLQLPVGHVQTTYAKIGDLWAWLCIAALLTFVAMAVTR